MTWEVIVGYLASVGTVAVWLTCIATLWLKYGLFKNDDTLIYVNGMGAILTLIYLVIYYANTSSKTTMHQQLTFGGMLLFPILIYLRYYAGDRDDAIFYMGLFCSSVTVLSYGSPLAAMVRPLQPKYYAHRSTHCMPFTLSFGNFIVALEWLLYGYLVDDLFIQVPNFLGAVLGAVQLSLFVKYPASSSQLSVDGIKSDRI
ncbi:hypothetical protein LSH36_924g00015 [Paralvinella palmiformis]|uniref:Sugar transporter SWEET1 n=1 Tax=Paralvinella palmiformis TaxID=53620 RepID=A0AAD9MSM9_9ANNE|nr:hypothetical protein LSH36_924g00015 [Paralvinella palmiformis]